MFVPSRALPSTCDTAAVAERQRAISCPEVTAHVNPGRRVPVAMTCSRYVIVLVVACGGPSPAQPSAPSPSAAPADAGATPNVADSGVAIGPCRGRSWLDLGADPPALRYRIFICGSYPIRSVSRWRIRVGSQEVFGEPRDTMLVGTFPSRPQVGDRVCIVIGSNAVCEPPITAEELARGFGE
jgi:hypothetical protein